MNKYFASVDLDSTLLRDDRTISETTITYVKEFVNAGNHFIINTGRPHQGAIKYLQTLDIHEPIIVNNGTAIVWYDDNYETIIKYETFPMDLDLTIEFNNKVKDYLNTALVTSIFDMYTYNVERCPFWILHMSKEVKLHEGDIPTLLNTEPIKAEYYVKKEFNDKFLEILNEDKYQNEFEVIPWGTFDGICSYEISKKGINKGSAASYLAKEFGIPQKNIASFGDQLNDIPMFKISNYKVAMINSRAEVIQESNFVSEYDCNNDGVINFLKALPKE